MNESRMVTIGTLGTMSDGAVIDIYVNYDECYGGYYVAAKLMLIEGDLKLPFVPTAFAMAWMRENCDVFNHQVQAEVVMFARHQVEQQRGLAWEVAERVADAGNLTILAFQNV